MNINDLLIFIIPNTVLQLFTQNISLINDLPQIYKALVNDLLTIDEVERVV